MRVLITGGAGFLGAALANRLLGEGHTVLALDDLSAGSVEVAVPRVFGYRSPEPAMERWRLEYLRHSR